VLVSGWLGGILGSVPKGRGWPASSAPCIVAMNIFGCFIQESDFMTLAKPSRRWLINPIFSFPRERCS